MKEKRVIFQRKTNLEEHSVITVITDKNWPGFINIFSWIPEKWEYHTLTPIHCQWKCLWRLLPVIKLESNKQQSRKRRWKVRVENTMQWWTMLPWCRRPLKKAQTKLLWDHLPHSLTPPPPAPFSPGGRRTPCWRSRSGSSSPVKWTEKQDNDPTFSQQ